MATPITDLRASLRREINIPGFPQLPDITNSELDGYIMDGFWEVRLLGMLESYTLTDGTEFATPPGNVIKGTTDDSDFPPQYQMLVVIDAGLRMLRLKMLELARGITAKAGPVEYQNQPSATVLRAILDSLQQRLNELKAAYSELFVGGGFHYFDGELQRESAILQNLAILTIT